MYCLHNYLNKCDEGCEGYCEQVGWRCATKRRFQESHVATIPSKLENMNILFVVSKLIAATNHLPISEQTQLISNTISSVATPPHPFNVTTNNTKK